MKGPSWADQTAAAEEEEEEQRRIHANNRPNNNTNTNTNITTTTHTRIQTATLAQSQRAPQSAYQQTTPSAASSQRGGSSDVRSGFRSNDRDQYPPQQQQQHQRTPIAANSNSTPTPRYGGYGGALARDSPAGARSVDSVRSSDSGPQWPRTASASTAADSFTRDDRRGGQNGYNQRDNRDARDNRSIRRPEPAPVVRESGIISTVKDGFGFLRCADRDGEVFFHFGDFPGSQHTPPRKGDEVSFRIQSDARDGRLRAQQLELLPKGSVQFETIVSEGVSGVIVREMRGQFNPAARKGKRQSLAESLAQGRSEAYGGKIERVTEGESASAASAEPEAYEFSERDLADPNILLFTGDRIRFNIFVEKKSQRKGATQVTLIEPNPIGRERGRVVSIKEAFGFLEVEKEINDEDDDAPPMSNRFGRNGADSRNNEQLFFHFSELIDPSHTPQVGDEFSFRIEKSPAEGNKVSAHRIQLLPKGSLNSREVGRETLKGTVTKEITFESSAAQNATPATVEAAPETSEQPPAEAASSPAPAAPQPTAETSTETSTPAASPSPTSTPATTNSTGRQAKKMIPGIITYVDSNGQSIELPFRPSDVSSPDRRNPTVLLLGDSISFHLLTLRQKSGVSTRATQISIKPEGWSKVAREQGILTQLREGFGFVDSIMRSEKIFLHASQVKAGVAHATRADERPNASKEILFVGLEVEFNVVQETPGKWSATRVITLPTGTVQFEETLPTILQAKVTKGIKRRETNKNAPKPGSDASSFSKNDLRRDQASGAATPARSEGRGEKGELGSLAPLSDSDSLPADLNLTTPISFYEVDVLDPAAGLDATSLVVGDTVELQLKRHKRTGRLTGTRVVLKSIESVGREQGQVVKLKPENGLGYLAIKSKVAPIVFHLRDAPMPKGAKVQIGDCFEFNISEPTAPSKKDRDRALQQQADDKPHAVRLTPLPRGSVEVEKVDRTQRIRGFISQVPERGGKNGSKVGNKHGTVVKLVSGPREADYVSSTLASILTHPAAWPLVGVEPFNGEYNPTLAHPAYFAKTEQKRSESVEEKYPFSFSDIAGNHFLAKGDLLDFYVSERAHPSVSRRAVEITLTPIQGVVDRIEMTPGQAADAPNKTYTGVISVFNPQANHSEESFVFASKDVTIPQSSDATSSTAAATPNELVVGDTVEFTEIILSQQEKKKRQAKAITRIREAAAKAGQTGQKRNNTSVQSVSVSRLSFFFFLFLFVFSSSWRSSFRSSEHRQHCDPVCEPIRARPG